MKNILAIIFFVIMAFAGTAQSGEKPTFTPYPWPIGTSCYFNGHYSLQCVAHGAESYQWEEYMYATNTWEPVIESQKFSGTKTERIRIVVQNPPFQHMLRCVLSNGYGVTISDSILYKAMAPPRLWVVPTMQSVCIGDPHKFTLSVDSENNFGIKSYTWQKKVGNVWLAVGDSMHFEISKARQSDLGAYRCVADGSYCGNVYSNEIELTGADCYSPTIQAHPQSNNYCVGGRAIFTTIGSSADSYEWEMLRDGAWIPVTDGPLFRGSKTNTLEVMDVQAGLATEYRCRLTNEYGVATSQPAKLSVKEFSFRVSPQQVTVCPAGNASFKVGGGGASSFAWQRRNGNNWQPIGANSNNLGISDVSVADTGGYQCVVSTECGDIATNNIALLELKEDCVVPIPASGIPNAFSPNGDGVNDQWVLAFLGNRPNCSVRIFSRHGAVVFESKGYPKPWDGTLNGKALPVGVYYYIISTNDIGGFTGSVSIVR